MDKTLKIALTTGVMTLGIVITATPVDAATMTTQQQAFVNKMTPAILADTSKYGLYPSIQMAQATLESGWGQSTLSTKANNYFGVKGAFNGQSVTMWTTEYSGGKPYSVQAQFAKYPSAYESVDAQGKLLKNGVSWNPEYYAGAWRSRAKNYKEAAYGLQGRYATAPTYAQSLINLIEVYHFDQLDNDGYKNGSYYLKGKPASGYINDGNGWFWFENGRKFTGFRFYMGTYYWFENGSRIDNKWRSAWNLQYYVDREGRAVQGDGYKVNGTYYNFGHDGTFFLRGKANGYVNTTDGWLWIENGQRYTGFRKYMGAYYFFINGVRQHNRWVSEWGLNYYVGSDGRSVQGSHVKIGNKVYNFGTNGTFYLR